MKSNLLRRCSPLLVCLALLGAAKATRPDAPTKAWRKGNTHAHTLWSDGNAAPEKVVQYYVEHGYSFLVLSDHNLLSRGERWFPVDQGRLSTEQVDELRQEFGADWVETRQSPSDPGPTEAEVTAPGQEMRLKDLDQLRARFQSADEFCLIEGEEVTSDWEGKPVHINALNIDSAIAPQRGDSLGQTIALNMQAILKEGERSGRPTLAHLNHPNYQWGIGLEELARLPYDNFFEVYNGHPGVRNHGDQQHPSLEVLWDHALTIRLEQTRLGLLYGIASDDGHDYYRWGLGRANPGRGWVMVRAESNRAKDIIEAMQAGEFYSSTGVTLEEIETNNDTLRIRIQGSPDEGHVTEFIGTLREHGAGEVGVILASTQENPAIYHFNGMELYVRARVTSSLDHPNPFAQGDKQMAWVQPVLPDRD